MAMGSGIGFGTRLGIANIAVFVDRARIQISSVDIKMADRSRELDGSRRLAGGTPRELAALLLRELPNRWAHTQTAAARAQHVASAVAAPDRDLLIAAAWLHDIGYATELTDTGFHPLDGARYLLKIGAPMRLASLVAHHSEAALLAEACGLLDQLEQFPRERLLITDALSYADMTAGPTGKHMTVPARLTDIRIRHAAEPPGLKAARLSREPLLRAAAARVQRRLAETGRGSLDVP